MEDCIEKSKEIIHYVYNPELFEVQPWPHFNDYFNALTSSQLSNLLYVHFTSNALWFGSCVITLIRIVFVGFS